MTRRPQPPGATRHSDAPGGAGQGRSWATGLLRAYPPDWRARYGDELELLVQDLTDHGRRLMPMAVDLLRGAAVAWLTERRIQMTERSRGALFTVLWTWVALAATAAWFGHDLSVYPTATAARQIALAHPSVPDAYHVLYAAGVVGCAATAIAAVAFAIGAARYAHGQGRRSTYVLMAVPPAVAAAWLGGLRLFGSGNGSPGGPAVFWLLLGVAGIAVSTQAVITIIRTCEFDRTTWRIGGAMAAAVTAAMLVATGATITWGLVIRNTQPHSDGGSGWLVITAIMAVTTARAVIAMIGSRRSVTERPVVA